MVYTSSIDSKNEETVDDLRQKLNEMKRIMVERQMMEEADDGKKNNNVSVIDGSFLSAVFGVALFVILTVSMYAFYNLYQAILKKFPSDHTEL